VGDQTGTLLGARFFLYFFYISSFYTQFWPFLSGPHLSLSPLSPSPLFFSSVEAQERRREKSGEKTEKEVYGFTEKEKAREIERQCVRMTGR
jgi:hypothetical protein